MVTVVLVVPFVVGAGRQTLVQEKKVENTQLTWGSLGATVTVVLVVLPPRSFTYLVVKKC